MTTKINLRLGTKYPLELFYNKGVYTLVYLTEEMESLSRDLLKKISDTIGSYDKVIFHTNAGIDMHSSETELYGIIPKRLRYDAYTKFVSGLGYLEEFRK